MKKGCNNIRNNRHYLPHNYCIDANVSNIYPLFYEIKYQYLYKCNYTCLRKFWSKLYLYKSICVEVIKD